MLKDTLLNHLQPAFSPAAFQLFTAIIQAADTLEEDEHWVYCTFADVDDDYTLDIAKSGTQAPANAPQALQQFLTTCSTITWGEPGDISQIILHDGTGGTLHTLGDDAFSIEGTPYQENINSPIDIGLGAFYFIHPISQQLCLYDEVLKHVSDTQDPVEIYMRELQFELLNQRHRHTWLTPCD